MTLSKEELIATVQKYYDSSNAFLFTTELSPEAKRHYEMWKQWAANMSLWKAFKAALRSALPNYITGETYPSADGGPRCLVHLPRESWSPTSNWTVVGCVSLLAPVYFVHGVEWDYVDGCVQNARARFGEPPSDMVLPTQIVARTIEEIFGFSAFPRELVETPVHLYTGLVEPPQTTLFHTLFTSEPSNIP
jgi:hypothetical protein